MARALSSAPQVGIIMGSQSDWETMVNAADTLKKLGVAFEAEVVSAHRTPLKLKDYALAARRRGLKVIIAGAGGAARAADGPPPSRSSARPGSAVRLITAAGSGRLMLFSGDHHEVDSNCGPFAGPVRAIAGA